MREKVQEVLNMVTDNALRVDHTSGNPHKTIIMVVAPSVRDHTLAPEGKGTLMIHCPAHMEYGTTKVARWCPTKI